MKIYRLSSFVFFFAVLGTFCNVETPAGANPSTASQFSAAGGKSSVPVSGLAPGASLAKNSIDRKPSDANSADILTPPAILLEDADLVASTDLRADRAPGWQDARGEEAPAIVGVYSNAEFSPVERVLRLAKKRIDIEIYEMEDKGIRSALRDALARGIQVRVIKEPRPIGEKCDAWGDGMHASKKSKKPISQAELADCLDAQKLRAEITASKGGRFDKFDKDDLCGQVEKKGRCYQHGKIIVIDARLALISTGNFNSSNLCDLAAEPSGCNRDYSYLSRDPAVVKGLETVFENDLAGIRRDVRQDLASAGASNKLTVSPWSFDPLANFLRSARKSIQIQNQYIYENSGLADVLIEQARRGIAVEVQLAEVCAFGRVKEKAALRLHLMFAEMEKAGIRIRMLTKDRQIDGKPGYLHAKAIVVDSSRAWIGSVNGSATSISQNREFGVFFSQPARVSALSRYMEADFSDPSSQTWRDSLACHRVGFADATATSADRPEDAALFAPPPTKGAAPAEADEEPPKDP